MKLTVAKVSKPKTQEVRSLVETYLERMKPLAPVESLELKEQDVETLQALTRRLPIVEKAGTHLVVLEEKGKEWSSMDLASQFKKWSDDPGIKQLVFLIGGPYGLPTEIRDAAKVKWSLSKGTLPGDLAWLVTVEQIYRAYSILKGTGYHHGD